MKINNVHCLFEQSGTFKNVFKSFGIDAYDYDLLNDFGETDYRIDLFKEIELAFDGAESIFDRINKDDLVFAFFPCTYFSKNNVWLLTGQANGMDKWNDEKKLVYSMERMKRVSYMYSLFCHFVIVLLRKGIRCVIENPFSREHFLVRYLPLMPSIIDKNRTCLGDCFVKPTQYYFINCKPMNNISFGADFVYTGEVKKIDSCNTVERSMILSDYARNFIRSFILDIDNSKERLYI